MITYEFAVLIGAVLFIAYIVYALILKRSLKRVLVGSVFIVYLTGVAIVTLFPIVYDDAVVYTDTIEWYNFIPLKTISSAFQNGITVTAVTQVMGNIALSVPFGVMVPILFKIPEWWKKLFLALSFSVTIELAQLLIGIAIGNMYRNIDVDDMILNVLGAYVGYVIYAVIPRKIKQMS